jgi:hypothetical protein
MAQKNRTYQNNKNNKMYIVIAKVTNTTNEQDGQKMVLYRALDKNGMQGLMYVREETEFDSKFTSIGELTGKLF